MHTSYKFRLKDIPLNDRFTTVSIFGWSIQFLFLATLNCDETQMKVGRVTNWTPY